MYPVSSNSKEKNVMIYDSHIHIYPARYSHGFDAPPQFLEKITAAGIGGGSIFSLPPRGSLEYYDDDQPDNRTRIHQVLDYCSQLPDSFYPFYWINPTEPNAVEQVRYAAEQGIRGFKVLCSDYYPEEGMKAYAECAKLGLPVMFHSGILWDGKVSSGYNRPLSFECLLKVEKLRFSLAHMSWPWIGECIALFGKFNASQRSFGNAPEMYIDSSPGAPEFDREEAFRKMGLICYGMASRLLFGVDSDTNQYNVAWAKDTLAYDRELFERLHGIYSKPEAVGHDLRFTRGDRETIDFREFFRKATEENYLNFIRK